MFSKWYLDIYTQKLYPEREIEIITCLASFFFDMLRDKCRFSK